MEVQGLLLVIYFLQHIQGCRSKLSFGKLLGVLDWQKGGTEGGGGVPHPLCGPYAVSPHRKSGSSRPRMRSERLEVLPICSKHKAALLRCLLFLGRERRGYNTAP